MDEFEKYKKGLKAYVTGFGVGVLVRFVICVIVGKPLFAGVLLVALLFGAIAFQMKTNKDEKRK